MRFNGVSCTIKDEYCICEVKRGGKYLPQVLKVDGNSADFGGNLPPYHREFQALVAQSAKQRHNTSKHLPELTSLSVFRVIC